MLTVIFHSLGSVFTLAFFSHVALFSLCGPAVSTLALFPPLTLFSLFALFSPLAMFSLLCPDLPFGSVTPLGGKIVT